ncbi:MAG TPA: YihY/virulence factor BrkB family protein, partial [Myxococcota bacterium]|nr:YihY/virulence factor BrkB family protein [Myxococcota bacterium]
MASTRKELRAAQRAGEPDRLVVLRHRLLTHTGLPPWAEPLARPARYLWVLYRRLQADRAFLRAAGMAYATLVALVPLLLLLFGALGATGVLQSNQEAVEALVFGSFLGDIPEVRDFLLPGLLGVDLGAMGLIGISGLALVSGRLYLQVESAYCEIFGVEVDRPFYVRVLTFYVAVTLAPVILVATFLRTWELSSGLGLSWAGHGATALVQLAVLLAAMKGFPTARVRWRPAVAGSVTSLVLLDVASVAFRRYLVLFAGDDPVRVIYGSVGVLPVFLLWLYLAWLMVLVGVEVAAVSQNYRSLFEAEYDEAFKEAGARVVPGPESALAVAAATARWFMDGRGPASRDDLAEATGMRGLDVLHVLRALEASAIVV